MDLVVTYINMIIMIIMIIIIIDSWEYKSSSIPA